MVVAADDRPVMPAWVTLLAWFGALLVLNVMGFMAAGLADPAGFDCSDPQVPNRTALTEIGFWLGALLGLVAPIALLAAIPKLSGRWWPIPLCLPALYPVLRGWLFLLDAVGDVC